MTINTKPVHFAQHVQTNEDIKEYLSIQMEENGIDGLIWGLNNLAKHKGMTEISKATGLNRQHLYRSLSENGNPKLETIDKIVRALGLRLSVEKL